MKFATQIISGRVIVWYLKQDDYAKVGFLLNRYCCAHENFKIIEFFKIKYDFPNFIETEN